MWADGVSCLKFLKYVMYVQCCTKNIISSYHNYSPASAPATGNNLRLLVCWVQGLRELEYFKVNQEILKQRRCSRLIASTIWECVTKGPKMVEEGKRCMPNNTKQLKVTLPIVSCLCLPPKYVVCGCCWLVLLTLSSLTFMESSCARTY